MNSCNQFGTILLFIREALCRSRVPFFIVEKSVVMVYNKLLDFAGVTGDSSKSDFWRNGMRKQVVKSKGALITLIGMLVMTVLIVVKLFLPGSLFSGYALLVGIALFFVVEAVEKTPASQSGLRFKTFLDDLKKTQVLLWVLLPVGITIAVIVCGKLFFEELYREYIEHVIGRTSLEMNFSNFLTWGLTSTITVLGEEIAFRGFFLGKGSKVLPKAICLLGSAVLFALAHIATGDSVIVAFDLFEIFVDAIFYAFAFQRSGNCLISFIPHCLNNFLGLLLVRLLFLV